MKNILSEQPANDLSGRTLFTLEFVEDDDIVGKNILNVGCGYGWFEYHLQNKAISSACGIEPTEKDLETAKNFFKSDRISFELGSALDIPFENEKFETVVSFEVIEHIPKDTEGKMFNEVNRVLKPGGTFYLSTPYDSFFANIFDPAYYFGHRHYGVDKLKKIAKDSGFSVEKISVMGGWWDIVSDNNMYIAKWVFRRNPFFEKRVRSLQFENYKKKKGFVNIFIKFRKK